jgi:hypothetical protein
MGPPSGLRQYSATEHTDQKGGGDVYRNGSVYTAHIAYLRSSFHPPL